MTIELYINGYLKDRMVNRLTVEQACEAMKSKWWFLLSKNDWLIYEVKESKMNRLKTIEPA